MATDWIAIRNEYVNSSVTYKELGEKYGIKDGTVRQRANRENWEDSRNALSQAVTQAAQEKLAEDRTEQLVKFNEDDLKMARAIRATAARLLKEVGSPSELRAIAGAADAAQKIGRLALGASTENTVSTIKQLEPIADDEFLG